MQVAACLLIFGQLWLRLAGREEERLLASAASVILGLKLLKIARGLVRMPCPTCSGLLLRCLPMLCSYVHLWSLAPCIPSCKHQGALSMLGCNL